MSTPVELTGYRQGPIWYDVTGAQVWHLELHTTASPWPLVLNDLQIAAALHTAGAALTADTDLDALAAQVLRGVLAVGLEEIRLAEVITEDVSVRITTEDRDTEDTLFLIELWGDETRLAACRHAARVLCEHSPTAVRTLPPEDWHCPTLGEVS